MKAVTETAGATPFCCSGATGKTYVKLAEGLQRWHLYNQEGLFAVPHEELGLIEYTHCPDYLYRN